MNDEYGLKGNVQRLEQRRQSSFNTDRLQCTRDHNSFDVEFSLHGQVLRKTYNTYGGVVHCSTRFDYDDSGRLVRAENFGNSEASVEFSQFAYSEAKCEWVSRDAGGVIVGRGVDEYDGQHLIRLATFDDQGRPKRIKSLEYSANRLTKSDSRYFLPDGTCSERWLADYDPQGRIHRTHGLKPDGSPLGDGKYLYEYSQDGRVNKVWSFNEFNDDNVARNMTIYEYLNDDIGNWIERREFHLRRDDSFKSRTITSRKLKYYS